MLKKVHSLNSSFSVSSSIWASSWFNDFSRAVFRPLLDANDTTEESKKAPLSCSSFLVTEPNPLATFFAEVNLVVIRQLVLNLQLLP